MHYNWSFSRWPFFTLNFWVVFDKKLVQTFINWLFLENTTAFKKTGKFIQFSMIKKSIFQISYSYGQSEMIPCIPLLGTNSSRCFLNSLIGLKQAEIEKLFLITLVLKKKKNRYYVSLNSTFCSFALRIV